MGYLDIFLSHLGKLNATKWLVSQIQSHDKIIGSAPTEFYFMGDDDNDIDIADAAKKAYVVRPCSRDMMKFALYKQSYIPVENTDLSLPILVPYIAINEGPFATNEILEQLVALKKMNIGE